MSGFFTPNRQSLRQMYIDCWQKHNAKQLLTPLEHQIVDIILWHPEYQKLLTETHVDKDYLPELGETNPFLHMSLHLAVREQINTNRPNGIQTIYKTLCQQNAAHDVEHQFSELLAETLWQAQRDQQEPNEETYLKKLNNLIPTSN